MPSYNLCAVLLMVSLTVALSKNYTEKYIPDSNRIIKRMHGSTDAKLFLHGCEADYIQLIANETTESKFFDLAKSKEYLFAIYTLDEVSLILTSKAFNLFPDEKEFKSLFEDVAEFVYFDISECIVFKNQTIFNF